MGGTSEFGYFNTIIEKSKLLKMNKNPHTIPLSKDVLQQQRLDSLQKASVIFIDSA